MNSLLIGGGGREHALAWAMAKSPLIATQYCAPGNAGIAQVATCVDLDVSDHAAVISFCETHDIGFVVIGPEAPLVAGLSDDLSAAGILAFGPSKAAAALEGSKGFTKDLCTAADIPTAAYARFDAAGPAKDYLATQPLPIVVKADGLAAGKGVVIAETIDDANAAIDACFGNAFGDAGAEVVIEAFLEGEEASFFVLCDGEHVLPLATAQDHKRAFDGDAGPNTGGMGAYSPAPVMSDVLIKQTLETIIKPTVKEMTARGMPFRGVLYAGLMITRNGPELIEYNVRFGDPECQALMVRLASDIVPALLGVARGDISDITLNWHDDAAITVVAAANGYPGSVEKGSVIEGLNRVEDHAGVTVFHAGTSTNVDGKTIANGGRVLGITARGETVAAAQTSVYGALDDLVWPDGFYRRDIGWRAVAREND